MYLHNRTQFSRFHIFWLACSYNISLYAGNLMLVLYIVSLLWVLSSPTHRVRIPHISRCERRKHKFGTYLKCYTSVTSLILLRNCIRAMIEANRIPFNVTVPIHVYVHHWRTKEKMFTYFAQLHAGVHACISPDCSTTSIPLLAFPKFANPTKSTSIHTIHTGMVHVHITVLDK